MMTYQNVCPYCGVDLKPKFMDLNSCSCGWFDKKSETDARKKMERKAAGFFVVATVLISFAFTHSVTWGSHSLKIPFTTLLKITGLLNEKGYGELAVMCTSAGKYDCTEKSYEKMFEIGKKPKPLLDLAYFQLRQKKDKEAVASFERYFKARGKDGEAMLVYAKLLENTGRTREALRFFDASIKARPEVLPVQATSGIVRIYLKQKKLREAYNRIAYFQASSPIARDYLNAELQTVKRLMRPAIKRTIASH